MVKKSSLIPKKSLSKPLSRVKKPSIFSSGAVLIFFISLGLAAGAFFYHRLLDTSIKELTNSLEVVKADFDPVLINELTQVSQTIEFSKTILAEHEAVSNVFEFLKESTLTNVRFFNFVYAKGADEYTLSMNGEASSYAAVAQQAAVFEASPFISQAAFSNFGLKGISGNVSFNVSIIIKPELLKFET